MSFLYVRPDESLLFGTATGTVDANFDANWLVDGRAGRPAKRTGNPSWAITAPSAISLFDLLAVVNHTVDAARAINITGDVSGTVTPGTLPGDAIPLNPFTTFTPTTVNTVTVGVTSNSVAVVIGEVYGGRSRSLERSIRLSGSAFAPMDPLEWEGEFGSIPPYESGLAARTLNGDTVVSATGLADIEAWWQSTRRGTRPTLIVPISSVNDAWLVTFKYSYEVIKNPSTGGHLYRVQFEFKELPRTRW